MRKSHSNIIELLSKIKKIKERYLSIEKDMVSILSNKTEYDNTVAHYDHVIADLETELKNQPIGYRYTGEYYLKKPYVMPAEYMKGSGSLFMRENLSSWQVETEPGVYDYSYHRAVYKQLDGPLLTREDAEPVYQDKK